MFFFAEERNRNENVTLVPVPVAVNLTASAECDPPTTKKPRKKLYSFVINEPSTHLGSVTSSKVLGEFETYITESSWHMEEPKDPTVPDGRVNRLDFDFLFWELLIEIFLRFWLYPAATSTCSAQIVI